MGDVRKRGRQVHLAQMVEQILKMVNLGGIPERSILRMLYLLSIIQI